MSEVFLYILTFSWGNQTMYRTPMPSWEACITVSEGSRGHVSDGADTEVGVVLFCGGEQLARRTGQSWVPTEVEG